MTLVVIGPVTKDLIVIGDKSSQKTGGATYFQSFVFDEFYNDYLAIINCSDESLVNDFPDISKVKIIKKENTHFFINNYPDPNNLDLRNQLSNFAKIPILQSDLEDILPDKIDAFVLNPLNRYDFPGKTVEYLKSFDVPIFLSIQGFLRVPHDEINGMYDIELDNFSCLYDILCGVDAIFLDETEANIIGDNFDVGETVITNGSIGSRIISDYEIKIDAVTCENIVDTTGCGDTYMAAYLSKRLNNESITESGNFASLISSKKLGKSRHY